MGRMLRHCALPSVVVAGGLVVCGPVATGLVGCGSGSGGSGERGGADASAYVRVSPRDARYFELDSGSPFVPIGLNLAFPRFLYDEGAVFKQLEQRLEKLSANRGNFIRVWLSHTFYDIEHEHSGEYDSFKQRRIDRLLALAAHYNVRVELTLEHFRNLEDSPPRSAGEAPMGKPIHHVVNGGPAADMTEFFTLEKSRAQFKRKIEWYAERYSEEPAVFAWKLWSEIDTVEGGGWQEWTREMLGELHRQLPNHLAVQGVGSLDLRRKQLLFEPIWKMPGNQIAEVRRYLDLGAPMEVCKGPVDVMAADAVRTVLAMNVGKPVVLATSGAVEPGQSGPFKLYEQDSRGTILHDVLFAPFFAGAAGPGQIWHWGDYVEKHDLWYHFNRFADAIAGLDPPAEQFEPSQLPHPRLRVYALRGKRTFLAWCRDTEADWRTELVESGVHPVRDAVIDLNKLDGGPPKGRVRLYNPWSGQWTDAALADGRLSLPPFVRSIVVRIEAPAPDGVAPPATGRPVGR